MKLRQLLSEGLTLTGVQTLYHYSKEDFGDTVILDPKKSVKYRSFYSNNDYKLSNFPRVFYYTDLNKTESQVVSGSSALYSTKVNGASILNLTEAIKQYTEDQKTMKTKNKAAYDVARALLGEGGQDWDAMFRKASKLFTGIFYDQGNLPIVNVFVPLKVTKDESR